MEVIINDIINIVPFLQKLVTIKLPARLAYRVVCLSNEIQNEADRIEKIRTQIADKYFEKDENGKFVLNEDKTGYKVKPELVQDYNMEILSFLSEKVELKSKKLPQDILDLMDDISATDLAQVTMFFE